MLDDLTELPEGWEETTLGEIILPYETAQPQKHPESEYRYIDIGSIDNSNQTIVEAKVFLGKDAPSRARRIVKEGDVLFSTVRTYLKNIARVSSDFDGILTSTGIAILRASEIVEPNYLFHYVISEEFLQKISSTMDGTLYPAINDSDLLNAFIPLPPLNEQKRIVAKIEELRSHTQAARNAIAHIPKLLEQFRQSVLAAAFRGDLTAEWRSENPDVEPAEVLLQRIRKERYQKWKDDLTAKGKDYKKIKYKNPNALNTDENYDVPSNWIWTNLGELSWSVKDGPHYSPKYVESGIPFISAGNVKTTGIDFKNVKFISPQLHQELSERCLPSYGDLLYTKGGTTGIAHVNNYKIDFNVWVHVAVLKCVPSLNIFYIQHALNSPYCYEQSQRFTHGVGNQDLGLTRMIDITVPLAPINEQKEIISRIEAAFEKIDRIEQQYQFIKTELDRLDRSILAKAFKGELVPQDPTDEAAIVLLERIRGDRASQIKSIKTKRKKHSV